MLSDSTVSRIFRIGPVQARLATPPPRAKNGILSQDTFLRIFRVLDPKRFDVAFQRWTDGILVDGKTLRYSVAVYVEYIKNWKPASCLTRWRLPNSLYREEGADIGTRTPGSSVPTR